MARTLQLRLTLPLITLLATAMLIPPMAASHGASDLSATTSQVRIAAADGAPADNFGEAVAIDGDLVAVGASYADIGGTANAGAVYFYQRDAQAPGGWVELTKLTADVPRSGGRFGEQVALQGDVLAVGAPHEDAGGDFDQGVVYIFERDQGGANAWGLTKKLTDDTLGDVALFGSALALDGGLLLVGAEGAYDHKGTAYLFARASGWGQVKQLFGEGTTISDEFGSAVALEGDTAVVGAARADITDRYENDGAAYIFERDQGGPNVWGQVAQLVADNPQPNSLFGDAVALDGDIVVIGAWSEDVEQGQSTSYSVGAAYIFERDRGGPNAWGRVKRLAAQDEAALDYYGGAVAVAGDEIWVAADHSDAAGFDDQGMVYRYEGDRGGADTWSEAARLEADDGSAGDLFGNVLAVSGTTIVVGAVGQESFQGAVYVFSENATADPNLAKIYLPLLNERAFTPTGVLTAGGSVQAPSGAVIGAVEGAIAAPVDVTIAPVGAPEPALGSSVTTVGDYYLVGAQQFVAAPADKPFLVGLPVPEGVDPAALSAAILTPPGRTLDGGGSGANWVPSAGNYDAANNLFVTTIADIGPESLIMVLIQNTDHAALAASVVSRNAEDTPEFQVQCWNLQPNPACTPTNQIALADELALAYGDFVDTLLFREPALRGSRGGFSGASLAPYLNPVDYFFGIYINTDPCVDKEGEDYAGRYHPINYALEICMSASGQAPEDLRRTVRHELFHAIQHAYSAMHQDLLTGNRYKWTMEGTAAAAEESSTSLFRSLDFEFRQIPNPLADESCDNYEYGRPPQPGVDTGCDYEYRAQDFWVYTGMALGQSLAYLQPIFEQGAAPEHVNTVLTLDSAYWNWVKNQIVEKQIVLNGSPTEPPCTMEWSVIGKSLTMSYPTTRTVQATLAPLSSIVVEIEFEQSEGYAAILADNDGDSDDLRYKVYESGEANCAAVPDGTRVFTEVPQYAERFVVLSNVSLDQSFTFVLQIGNG